MLPEEDKEHLCRLHSWEVAGPGSLNSGGHHVASAKRAGKSENGGGLPPQGEAAARTYL